MKVLISVLILVFPSLSYSQSNDFAELFEQATKFNSQYLNQSINVETSAVQASLAKAALRPQISLTSTHVFRDISGNTGTGDSGNQYSMSTAINASQSLFAGGGEYKAFKLAGRLADGNREELKSQKLQFFLVFSLAYLNSLEATRLFELSEKQIEILKKQLNETRKRVKIGRNRKSDQLALQSRLAVEEANLLQLQFQADDRKMALSQLVGKPILGLLNYPDFTVVVDRKTNSEAGEHPVLKSLSIQIANSEDSLGVTKAEYLPSLDLSANYYLDRNGVNEDTKWDVSLTGSWDLFTGLSTKRQASLDRAEVRKLVFQKREASFEIREGYKLLDVQIPRLQKSIQKIKAAKKWAAKSLIETEKDYSKSLVDQIELLRAADIKYETDKSEVRLLSQYHLALARKVFFSGGLP